MTQKAKVTSVDAIEDFRARLIVYLTKARPTLDEINADVMRTRVWVQGEQRNHWEQQVKRCKRKLEDAQQALFSARLSNMREPSSAEIMAVTRAKREMEAAEAKLQIIKRWDRDYENQTEPLARQLEKLHSFLAEDMNQAVFYLTQVTKTLRDYAGIAPPSIVEAVASTSAAPPVEEPAEEKGA